MATSIFNFTTLNGSDPAGHDSINILVQSIENQLASVSSGLSLGADAPGSVTTGQVLRWTGTTYANAFVNDVSLVDGAVTEAKIASSAVTATKIANDAVALGTKTTGNYVGTITGTANQIASTGATTGEGIDHTLSLVSSATLPGTPMVQNAPIFNSGSIVSDTKIVDSTYVNSALSYATTGGVTLAGNVTGPTNNNTIATGAVTSDKILNNTIVIGDLATALQEYLVPTGTVQAFAGASAPTGWLVCDGSAVSTTTYATLYSVISTTYNTSAGWTAPAGGTFRVPDLRGRAPIGTGTGIGLLARTLASAIGDEKLQAHTHSAGYTVSGTNVGVGTHNHNVYFRYIDYYGTANYSPAGNAGQYGFGSGVTSGEGGAHNHEWSGTIAGNSGPHNQSQGSGQNMQPSLPLTYIIKT